MAVSFVRSFLRLGPLSRFRPTSRMLLAYLACVLTAHVAFGAGESRLYRVLSMSSPVYVEGFRVGIGRSLANYELIKLGGLRSSI
jgi:hypothetical protein